MSALATLARTGWRLTTDFDPVKRVFVVSLIVRAKLASELGMTYHAAVSAGWIGLGYVPAGEHVDVEEAAQIALRAYETLRSGPLGRFIGTTGAEPAAPRVRSRVRERTRA